MKLVTAADGCFVLENRDNSFYHEVLDATGLKYRAVSSLVDYDVDLSVDSAVGIKRKPIVNAELSWD